MRARSGIHFLGSALNMPWENDLVLNQNRIHSRRNQLKTGGHTFGMESQIVLDQRRHMQRTAAAQFDKFDCTGTSHPFTFAKHLAGAWLTDIKSWKDGALSPSHSIFCAQDSDTRIYNSQAIQRYEQTLFPSFLDVAMPAQTPCFTEAMTAAAPKWTGAACCYVNDSDHSFPRQSSLDVFASHCRSCQAPPA